MNTDTRSNGAPKKARNYSRDASKLKMLHALRNVLILAVALFVLLQYVIGLSVVSGNSMAPSLLDQDLVLYTRIGNRYKRGSLVSVALPSGEYYVKRVIAVAGDEVDIRDGIVYVNGVPEEGDYFKGPTLPEEGAFTYPLRVEEGSVFVLGDNRADSIDSRFLGPVAESQLGGLLRLRIGWLYIQGL